MLFVGRETEGFDKANVSIDRYFFLFFPSPSLPEYISKYSSEILIFHRIQSSQKNSISCSLTNNRHYTGWSTCHACSFSNALFEIRGRARFESFRNFIARIYGDSGSAGRPINIDTSFFFCLFSSIHILLRVYYAIMSDREFIRANGESRCVDTEIANERTDARPRISRYTIRMLLPARIYLPTFASPHYFVQSGNSKPEISRLRFYFTPLWNRICPVRFGLYTRLDK